MDGLNIASGFLVATYTIRKHRDRFRVNVRRDGRVVADVGGWKITGKDNRCMMTGFYQHNSTGIVLSADRDVGALLIVAGMNWEGRWSTARSVAFELYFDGNHQATAAIAPRDDGIVIPLSEQGVREFMAARYMAIREGGEILGTWGLKGTSAATMELSSCYTAMIGNTM